MAKNGAGGGIAQRTGRTINGRGGRFAGTEKLTQMERAFVRELVANGGKLKAAATAAGYQYTDNYRAAHHLMQRKPVIEAVRKERARVFDGQLANQAIGTIREVLSDPHAPAGARLQAARLVLERTGEIGPERRGGRDDAQDKDLADMTIEQLQQFISEGQQMISARVIDGEVVREQPPAQPAKLEDQVLKDFLS